MVILYVVHLRNRYVFGRTKYYPVCLGECPAIRLKNKQQGKTFVCNASVKEHIEFAIKDYCLRTINNKKLS